MKPSVRLCALFLACAALTGCGGGGGGSPESSSQAGAAGSPGAASTPASGGSPGAGNTSANLNVPQSNTPNVQPIAVNVAPGLTRNMLTTSVTLCQSGTDNCATVDDIQVDTGSNGLRILASALPASLALAAVPSGSGVTGECAVFGSGYAWGAVRSADVRMAGQVAASIPVHLIADTALPSVPADCASSGPAMLTVAGLRGNGILGIGLFTADCGSGCANAALPRWYYRCDVNGACVASAQALAQQVANPVSHFALDNNGVVIDLPAIPDTGALSVSGSLIFGIGTQADNTLGGASIVKANATNGYLVTNAAGQTYPQSYIDSGSNGLFFRNTQFPQCGFWYCPSSMQTVSAAIVGVDGASSAVSFPVGNSTALFASPNNAFNSLAGPTARGFGWGLPFFYGRRVYTAIASRNTSAGQGPYYAF
ncbi:uncharacterized protein DUF3443 [Paraburkholderia sp. RAU2J]|uniref:DUF3443 domain-containing protein n=1 Tax=Paraburkholderia sp. RAU2J TaxID=1938810 RepID=UPI000EB11E35|nr:DUF3443 domain-containing protein [Paraburkholderia sp. RAU2J]RKT26651.1 uncharacterized protein DUF3443 [Paraburkholderia sp. RAU2J]